MKQRLAAMLLALACAFNLAAEPGKTKTIGRGGSATLRWTFVDGVGVIDNSVGSVTSGQSVVVTGNWNGTRTYTLTVTNTPTDFVTDTVTVEVTPVVMGIVTPADVTRTVNATQTFAFSGSTGGATNGYTWSATAGTINPSTGAWVAPATPGTVTITATSADDASKTASTHVTVVAAPVATSLVASNTAPAHGATFTLTPTYTAGTATITYNDGASSITCPSTGVTSAAITANWVGARVFTLTVTNAAGTTDIQTVTVTPTAVGVTGLTPATKDLSLTKTVEISGGIVSGAVSGGVEWLVNGVLAGDISTVGSISAGLYTAPTAMPASGSTITIRARSVDNPAVYQEMVITLYKLPTIQSFTVE